MRIGIDLGGTKIEGILLSPSGEVLGRVRQPSPQGHYQDTLAAVTAMVEALESDLDRPATVGIGVPGAVSQQTRKIKNANSTWLIGRPLDQDLAAALGRPVRIANDANCFALSEASDGAAAGAELVFGVILGTGVGGGLVVDRRCLVGRNAIAGEWGHNPLPWPRDEERPGPACYCGKSGCVETFLSGPGLARDHAQSAQEALSGEAIVERAQNGDAAAGDTLRRYEDRLARALASVINVFDPDVIVLGGGLSNIATLYQALPGLLPLYVFSDRVDTEIRPPLHGDASGVRGAAWLWSPEEAAALADEP